MAPDEQSVAERLAGSRDLANQLAQMAAHATLLSLSQEPDGPRWTYNLNTVIRQTSALSLDLARRREDPADENGDDETLLAANAWERIANISTGRPASSALISAAIHYDLAGYQANSICLARRAAEAQSHAEDSIDQLVADFLQRRYVRVVRSSRRHLDEPDPEILDGLSDEELVVRVADGGMAEGIRSAVQYFLSGEDEAFTQAVEILDRAATTYGTVGDASHYTVARALTRLLPVMKSRSTWTYLGHVGGGRWLRYLRILARGLGSDLLNATSISELWPSQMHAIDNGLLDPDKSLIIRMPTSAGKTRIAEMAMIHRLSTQPGSRCIYIAPYRALVSEIEQGLTNLFSDVGFAASSISGAYETDELGQAISRTDELLVLTPEKLDLLLRLQPEQLETVRLIVIDEGHIVGDRSRGAKFELLLSRLKKRLPRAQFLFMSAVVPDETLTQFARWLAEDQSAVLDSSWRPSIQRYAQLEWNGTQGTLRYSNRDVEPGGLEFVPNVIAQKTFEHVYPETGRRRRPKFPDSKGQVAAELAYMFAEQGPVLVFCALPDWGESVARELLERIRLGELVDEEIPREFTIRQNRSRAVAEEWLGESHPVTEMLSRGVAFHHGRLPSAVREAIEQDVRDRGLAVLVATNTLGQGVNLPFKTVVIHSTRRWDEDLGRPDPISARDFWNIAGRAGRAGHETEGLIIHIVATQNDREDFVRYEASREAVEPVVSALLRLLVDLVQDRISDEEAAQRLDSDLLALLVEEDVDVDEAVQETLDASLFHVQALDIEAPTQRLVDVAQWASHRILDAVPDHELRGLYASTGLSSGSCELLREAVNQQPDIMREHLESADLAQRDQVVRTVLAAVQPIREMATNAPDIGHVESALLMWIDGALVSDMADDLDVDAIDLTRFIEDVFNYRLPWVTSGFFQIAAHVLGTEIHSTLAANLPGMIKHGVPTAAAAWAMTAGVAPRRAAIRLSQAFLRQPDTPTPGRFRRWLGRLDVESLDEEFDVGGYALQSTARAVYRSSRNRFLENLETAAGLFPLDVLVRPSPRAMDSGLIWHLEPGSILTASRDFDSTINRNAVYLSHRGLRVGYLPWDASQAVGPEMDAGVSVEAEFLGVDESDQRVRLSIQVRQR